MNVTLLIAHPREQCHQPMLLDLRSFRPKVSPRLERPVVVSTNPASQSLHIFVDNTINIGIPRRQLVTLHLELGQDFIVVFLQPVERAIQIDALFVHDDSEDIVATVSLSLLLVIRV